MDQQFSTMMDNCSQQSLLDELRSQNSISQQSEDLHYSDESMSSTTDNVEVILKLSLVDEENNFTKLDWTVFEQSIDLISKSWRFISFSDRHSSAIFAEFDNETIESLLKITSLNILESKVSVKIVRLNELSISKGILYNPVTIPMSTEHLMNKLKSQGVISLLKLQKSVTGSKEKFFTGSIILTVVGEEVPQFVRVGVVKLSVRPLAPRLMLCSHCSLLGHTAQNCKKKDINLCRDCFNSHALGVVCPKLFCKNCNGNHSALRKDCPAIIEELKIVKLKERLNLSYIDAKNILISGTLSNIPQYAAKDIIEQAKHTFNRNRMLLEELKVMTDKCIVLSVQKDKALEDNKLLMEDNQQIPELKLKLEKTNQELVTAYGAISSKDSLILEQSEVIKELNESANQFTNQLENTSNQIKHFSKSNEDLKAENVSIKDKYKELKGKFDLMSNELAETSKKLELSDDLLKHKKNKITYK